MTGVTSRKRLAALNPRHWNLFGRAENKALLNQVEELKAELQRAREEIVSLETQNKELCENNMVQKTTIQQLTENATNQDAKIQHFSKCTTNQEAQIQQLSQNAARQEAKIQQLCENTTNQDAKIQELSAYLRSEEEENKTLWGQILYLNTELDKFKKSTDDWKDLYHRERDLHAESKKRKLDLEKQLNSTTQHLQAQLNLRGLMVAAEKQLTRDLNELQAKYEELQQAHETLLKEQQEQPTQKGMLSLQQSVSEQTELIKSLLAEQQHMSNTIMLMTEAASERERSSQQEMEELKHEVHLQSSPNLEDDSVYPDIVHLEEHVGYPNQELERVHAWAEEQSDLLNKQKALYQKEKRQRRTLNKQLKKAKRQPKLGRKTEICCWMHRTSWRLIGRVNPSELHH